MPVDQDSFLLRATLSQAEYRVVAGVERRATQRDFRENPPTVSARCRREFEQHRGRSEPRRSRTPTARSDLTRRSATGRRPRRPVAPWDQIRLHRSWL